MMQIQIPFLDLDSQHAPLRAEIDQAIRQVIDSGAFAGGPFVLGFEEDFASYCQTRYAVGLGSGTEALWLALLACGVGPGDEVITVPSTFMATAEAITYCGAKPVFVDVDPVTYTMDPLALEPAITGKTKAIIPVHLFGQSADMDPIMEIARRRGLFVIEDACQAHGADYKGQRVGSIGDAGCFSFYPGKNLGAFGEAGAVVTNHFKLQEMVRILRDHGQARKYYHTYVGWNCRMDGIQGAVLQVKLRHLENANQRRRSHAAFYNEALAGLSELIVPVEASYARHVYHLYSVRVRERDMFMKRLADLGVGTAIHYPVPVHLQEAYQSLGYGPGAFPVAELYAREFVSLPMFPSLSRDQVGFVVQAVKEALGLEALV
jgi:dTDP-4-amino-4,6-dideoxygalactose transaminase